MTKTDQLLEAVLNELRGLRADLRRRAGEPEPTPDETIGPFLNDSGSVVRYVSRGVPVDEWDLWDLAEAFARAK
jgi:hypothetical protein